MSTRPHTPRRVLVIGLDGGTPDILRLLAEEGHMPFLKSVMEDGVFGRLESVFPPVTPPAWTTFMTGKNPGKHGIFEFHAYDGYDRPLRVVNGAAIRGETLWSLLSRAGKRLGAVSVPMTFPPKPVNGVMMGGILSPSTEETFTYPESLYSELREKLGELVLSVNWSFFARSRFGKFLEELSHSTRQRARYARHLMEREPWDFFMVVFSETDFLQHTAWSFLDPQDPRGDDPEARQGVRNYMRLLDSKVQELCEVAGPDTQVLFVSDHGFGPFLKIMNINTWLEQRGWLAHDEKKVRGLRRLRKLRSLVRRIDPLNLRKKLPLRMPQRSDLVDHIRWDETRAFAILAGEGGIRINLKGRESQGIVNPGREYEELRDDIIAQLRELVDPETGERLVTFVKKREEVYSGPAIEKACDILFMLADLRYLANVFPGEEIFEDTVWEYGSGTHRMDGIFGAVGPGIEPRAALDDAKLEDVLPTILYSMDLAIPDDVDGRILTEIYSDELLAAHSPRSTAAIAGEDALEINSPEAENQVIERLRGLGYID